MHRISFASEGTLPKATRERDKNNKQEEKKMHKLQKMSKKMGGG